MNAPFDVLPLVVGVTGHRDPPLEAEAKLRERFRDVLKGLQQRHPSTQLLVLSGLAAGADIFAAEEAVTLGIAVMGCLPMPQVEYEGDFTTSDLERFRRVIQRCWDVVIVGTPDRHEQRYVDVANFIAYYSHVLVAFWDGLPARGLGGTAHVVDLRMGGLPDIVGDALVAYMPDTGPVIQIITPRKGEPPPDRCFETKAIYPDRPATRWNGTKRSVGEDAFEDALAHLERFDRDLANEPASDKPNRLAALADRTDAAANRLQVRTMRSLWSVYIAAGLAGAAQLVLPSDGSLHIPSWAGIVARIGFLAVAFVVFAIAKRNDFENRYQDYRAIAEALRVQCAWWSAGLRKRLVEASYLQMQQGELEWIRLALRTAYLVTGATTAKQQESPKDSETARWIDGQIEYYETVGKREEAHLRRARRAMLVAAVGGGALSAAAAISAWALSHQWLRIPIDQDASILAALTYWATMPAAVGSMLAVLIRFYEQQRGFGENARRYQLMFTVFDAARRRLRSHAEDPRKILEQLGHEALSEHAEWLILHRDRPLTFVHT